MSSVWIHKVCYFLYITILLAALVEAARVKAAGFTIIAVGVTDSIDEDELRAVASKPEYVITANDYSVLDYIASKTSDIACSEGKKVTR